MQNMRLSSAATGRQKPRGDIGKTLSHQKRESVEVLGWRFFFSFKVDRRSFFLSSCRKKSEMEDIDLM